MDHFDVPGMYDDVNLVIAPRTRVVVGVSSGQAATAAVERVSCARLWPFAGQSRAAVVAAISRQQEPSPAPMVDGGWYRWCRSDAGCLRFNAEDVLIDASGQPTETAAATCHAGITAAASVIVVALSHAMHVRD